jgi:LacI family transcriptional regulator
VPKLFADNEEGGYLAGRHLADHGHRRIVYIGGPQEMISTRRRFLGLERALMERGEPFQVTRYEGSFTVEFGRQAARRFIDEGKQATGIFASSDEIAIGLIEVLLAEGVSVPGEVSVIGFDDVGPLHLFAPPLTAIRQPVRALGERALALVLETNWQEPETLRSEELLPVEIVVRNSVAPPSKQ